MTQHYVARPIKDGRVVLGSPAVIDGQWVPPLMGDYVSLENFLRFQVRRFGNDHADWEISIGDTYAPHTVYTAHVTPCSASFRNVPQKEK